MTTLTSRLTLAILILLIALTITVPAAYAQAENSFGEQKGTPTITAVPRTMAYQASLNDDQGGNVPQGDYDIIFSIYDALEFGNLLWAETLLVAVDNEEVLVPVADGHSLDRAHAARQVAALRTLHVDHLRTEVGQVLAGDRPLEPDRQVDDAYAVQRAFHFAGHATTPFDRSSAISSRLAPAIITRVSFAGE